MCLGVGHASTFKWSEAGGIEGIFGGLEGCEKPQKFFKDQKESDEQLELFQNKMSVRAVPSLLGSIPKEIMKNRRWKGDAVTCLRSYVACD